MRQARASTGNLSAEARSINGVMHTASVWESRSAMLAFIHQGAHQQAIAAFPTFATGKTFGYETETVPNWSQVHQDWLDYGRSYGAPTTSPRP